MKLKDLQLLKESHESLLEEKELWRNIKIIDLMYIGTDGEQRIAKLCREENVTVGHFHEYLVQKSEDVVLQKIRGVLKNKRANEVVLVKTDNLHDKKRVVDDVNHYGHISLITFFHTLNELFKRTPGYNPIKIDHESETIKKYQNISVSARKCRALSPTECIQPENRRHCKLQGRRVCVPKQNNVKAPISDGKNHASKFDQKDVPYEIRILKTPLSYPYNWRRVGSISHAA